MEIRIKKKKKKKKKKKINIYKFTHFAKITIHIKHYQLSSELQNYIALFLWINNQKIS